MKRFLIYTSIFLSILILFGVMVAFVGRFDNVNAVYSDNGNIKRIKQKANFDSLDILFVGNSYCYSGINPAYFDSINIQTFNLGIPTAGPYIYELVVDDYLRDAKHLPENVFFLISPMTFSSKADNFPAYPIHRYLNQPISNEKLVLEYGIVDQYVNLSKKSFVKGIENLKSGIITTAAISPLENKGYSPSDVVVNDSIVKNSESLYLDLLKNKLNQDYVQHLMDLSDRLLAKGVKVTYFELPTYKLKNYFNPDYLEDYEGVIEAVLEKYGLVRISPNMSDLNYRNIDHLNANGATKCTLEMIRQLNLKKD